MYRVIKLPMCSRKSSYNGGGCYDQISPVLPLPVWLHSILWEEEENVFQMVFWFLYYMSVSPAETCPGPSAFWHGLWASQPPGEGLFWTHILWLRQSEGMCGWHWGNPVPCPFKKFCSNRISSWHAVVYHFRTGWTPLRKLKSRFAVSSPKQLCSRSFCPKSI